jgi:hypothetical protein
MLVTLAGGICELPVHVNSGPLICITSCVKNGSAIQKLIWRDINTDTHTHIHTARLSSKPAFMFSNKGK